MKIVIPIEKENKYYAVLKILKFLKPFSTLRNRELQVFSELLSVYNEYKDLKKEDRNKLTFDYDVRSNIADKYSISKDSVYNIMMSLRRKGLIGNNVINSPYADTLTDDLNKITFEFKTK